MEKATVEIPLWSSVNSKTAALAGSLILVVLGAVGLIWVSAGVIRGEASTHWVAVSGQIISLEWHSPSDGGDFPVIQYSFEFKGIRHTGSRIAFGPASAQSSRLGNLVPGSSVTVYVDPARPEEAVLEPGPSRFAEGALVLSVGLVLLGLCIPLIGRLARA